MQIDTDSYPHADVYADMYKEIQGITLSWRLKQSCELTGAVG